MSLDLTPEAMKEVILAKCHNALRRGYTASGVGFKLLDDPGLLRKLHNPEHTFRPRTLEKIFGRLSRLDAEPFNAVTKRYLAYEHSPEA